jgi:predicted dienelactone hydrolase
MSLLLARRRLLLGAAAAAALAAATCRAAAQQLAPDDHQVHEFDWVDSQRQRPVPVRLYWPADSTSPALVPVRPLVVFSHGIGGSRRGYSHLGRHFARQGYASLHLQHVGSDHALWRGSPLGLVDRLQQAAQDSEALARVADLRFALDQLLASPWGPRVDARRIAVAGHSYGANTSLLAAGARVPRPGGVVQLQDARLRAAILISAPPFYGEPDLPAILSGVTLPTLHITATEDVIRIPGYVSPAADRVALFEATPSRHKVLAVFAGGSHSVFTDRTATGGVEANGQIKLGTQALSTAFLNQVFQADGQALAQWPQQFAPLLARYVGLPA